MIKVKLWLSDKNDKNQLYPVQLEEVEKAETEKQLERIFWLAILIYLCPALN